MSATAVSVPKSPRSRWRLILQIEQLLLFVGLALYAILAALNQKPPLIVFMGLLLIVGNFLIPLAFAARRVYARRPYPWNWMIFFPVQIGFGLACAFACIILLRLAKIDLRSFWEVFRQIGYLTVLVVVISNFVMYALERLKEKNAVLEQTVEKGTIALQEQEEELKRAREIQQALLPNTLPQISGAQIAAAWQPARAVGGDYFDVVKFDDRRIGICVGDVAGKGITAALLMANLQASFRALATTDTTPQSVCTRLNTFLCANTAPGKFVTFFYAVLDAEKRTLIYENAGHCPGILLRSDGTREALTGSGAVLGALAEWTYADHDVQLRPGDKLLLVTDGITEAENAKLEDFGDDRLLAAAQAEHGSAAEIQRAIMQRVTAFCDGIFRDDATLLVTVVN